MRYFKALYNILQALLLANVVIIVELKNFVSCKSVYELSRLVSQKPYGSAFK